MENILSEYEEQCLLVEWLEIKGLKFSKIAQDTFTKSWGIKIKNKRSGVRPGVPDMLILLPKQVLFIEMKRVKNGTVSPEQKEWIQALGKYEDVCACICKGFEEAKNTIQNLLK